MYLNIDSGITEHPALAGTANNKSCAQYTGDKKGKKVSICGCTPLPLAIAQTDADAADRGQWVKLI